ncbi:hypothetical protein TNCV_4452981 [Trichonephila clavipes]|nr:hypothetical protein TNCV_4452981 [Trichonephila clavipes]
MMEHVVKASALEVVYVEELLNIMFSKKKRGPTSYAKQNIENCYVISSWRLLIDEPILHHIKNCTEKEAHRQLGKKEWSTALAKLDAFISILYAQGIYSANNIELDNLWSALFEVHLFSVIQWQEINL